MLMEIVNKVMPNTLNAILPSAVIAVLPGTLAPMQNMMREALMHEFGGRLDELRRHTGAARTKEIFDERRAKDLTPPELQGKNDNRTFEQFADLFKNCLSALSFLGVQMIQQAESPEFDELDVDDEIADNLKFRI